MNLDKSKTVSFSGYRPQKFEFPLSNHETYNKLVRENLDTIVQLIKEGYDSFIFGGAPGFDIISGELVIIAKKLTDSDIKLICALPYADFINSRHFDEEWRQRLRVLLTDSDDVVNVTGKIQETRGCYQRRNEFLIDNSSKLICYHTGKKGGTGNTIKYAKEKGVAVINLAEFLK